MEPLSRPALPRTPSERVRAWVEWFGIWRLVAASFATVIVVAGAIWLVRTPPPPTEASLPVATTSTVAGAPGVPSVGGASSTSEVPTTVVVHVAGSVVEPGVYELQAGARVRDAVVAAGGPTDAADWNALNLAAVVADGTKVYVPAFGEEVPPELAAPTSAAGALSGPVDLNRATAEELDRLPGVGPATANAIVVERDRNGPFATVDDLERVPGIGPAKLDAIRDLVTT